MKYLDEYRDEALAKKLLQEIERCRTQEWTIMEVCGGQTHSIVKHSIDYFLPKGIDLVHGPGCPVGVTPLEMIDRAHAIAVRPEVIFCSSGDMLRVPGSQSDLFRLKSQGADVRVVYSPLDSLRIPQANPERRVVFFAIGFETTAPANAMAVHQAHRLGMKNFSLLVSHVRVPPALRAILESPQKRVQGFIGPGHVCTVMRYREYDAISAEFKVPIMITGFEPVDILEGVFRVVRQFEPGRATVENQYSRVVSHAGNLDAQQLMQRDYVVCDEKWRGVGSIPASGYKLQPEFKDFDAARIFPMEGISPEEPAICISGQILRGLKKPYECTTVGRECSPQHPLIATKVSAEGACAAYFNYGHHQAIEPIGSWRWQGAGLLHTDDHAGHSSRCGESALMDDNLMNPLGSCPIPFQDSTEVLLGHGSGGKLTADLIEHLFLPAFRNPYLEKLDDQAEISVDGIRLAFTTDSYVVTSIFFPGGDIGQLAGCGTVNDLAVSGARPLYLSAAFVLEEGLPLADLARIVASMRDACATAGVVLVTGDTKVVNRGSGDKIFINTSGEGRIEHTRVIAADQVRAGDLVILSGTIADHGMAVMFKREGLEFETEIRSDTAPLTSLVQTMLEVNPEVYCLRDPTRGGVATSLHEIARRAHVGVVLEEKSIPIREDVKGACEILGIDPLYVANEGKLLVIVDRKDSGRVLEQMRGHQHGRQAQIIGEVGGDHTGLVIMRTSIGGTRIVDVMLGEQLPRIC